MDWMKTTLNPVFFPIFWGLIRTAEQDRNMAQIEKCIADTAKKLAIMERQLESHDYISGPDLTMGDLPLGAVAYRYFSLEIPRPALPNIEAWYSRLCGRPAYQQHGMVPFGSSQEEWIMLEKAGAET